MVNEEAILAKLAQIEERLAALESVRTDQVVIEGGTVHVHTGEHAPILVAQTDRVSVKAKRGVTMHIGGDLKGNVRTKEGKLRIKAKGDVTGGAWTEDGEVEVRSKKGDIKFDLEAVQTVSEENAS